MTERIQLRRTKDWRKPEGAIVVARPSKWGNPYVVGEPDPYDRDRPYTPETAVEQFAGLWRFLLRSVPAQDPETAVLRKQAAADLSALVGHDLACWCPLDQPCHADVLLDLARAVDLSDLIETT